MFVQSELKEKLASMYDCKDIDTIFAFGFRTQVSCSLAGGGLGVVLEGGVAANS